MENTNPPQEQPMQQKDSNGIQRGIDKTFKLLRGEVFTDLLNTEDPTEALGSMALFACYGVYARGFATHMASQGISLPKMHKGILGLLGTCTISELLNFLIGGDFSETQLEVMQEIDFTPPNSSTPKFRKALIVADQNVIEYNIFDYGDQEDDLDDYEDEDDDLDDYDDDTSGSNSVHSDLLHH